MISLPFDITGAEADQLRAVLAGQADYCSAAVTWNGRRLTVVVALEGYDPTAPQPERKPEKPSGYPPGYKKPGYPGGEPVRPSIVTGVKESGS